MLDDLGQEVGDLAREVGDLAREVGDLGREVGDLAREVDDLAREVDDLAREVDDLAREVGDLAREVGDLAREVDDLAREVGDLAREVDEHPRQIAEHPLFLATSSVLVLVLVLGRSPGVTLRDASPSDTLAPMALVLGSYEVEAELGRGAFGRVYRARHRPTGAVRALKLVDGVPDRETLARFEREAAALARVGGDGVVPVHEAGLAQGRYWFVMDLMPGGSLRARLKARGRLEWREAVTIALAVARALARCHAAGVVHRDVKPDNVLFDDEGRPRLSDFGVVRDLHASVLTETGGALGTPAYMAPEQLDGARVDGRADVYATGVLLHELVAGERPFQEKASVLAMIREKREG